MAVLELITLTKMCVEYTVTLRLRGCRKNNWTTRYQVIHVTREIVPNMCVKTWGSIFKFTMLYYIMDMQHGVKFILLNKVLKTE